MTGPRSRWVSLNQARAKASANSSGLSLNRREMTSISGSTRSDRSVVSMVGRRFFAGSNGSGMIGWASLATHWFAPAGLLVSSHS
ncbi:Uncharacterised protein [Mycobacteroides abscessus subsp. abscessus]|nr:Uncharacterised protein [Mycobacteroides abscessus subsp. abscessus]